MKNLFKHKKKALQFLHRKALLSFSLFLILTKSWFYSAYVPNRQMHVVLQMELQIQIRMQGQN